MNIILFDFEVFKYDTLLGCKIIDSKNNRTYYQSWNLTDIKKFYLLHSNDIWIGHNNERYDNLILEAIVKNKNPYETNLSILNSDDRFKRRVDIQLYYLDLMTIYGNFYSLKMTEAADGKNISETQVDFALNRNLTDEEKQLTEKYNRDDLDQTDDNFKRLFNRISIRFDLLKEFNLDMSHLNDSETKLASLCLKAKKVFGLENQPIKPVLYDTLELKNEALKEFYLNEEFKKGKHIKITVANCEHTLGSGGAHAAQLKYHTDKALYFDVSGYYNLTMMNHDLLPRTLDDNAKELYEFMYHEQLRLKKINPQKRGVYKTILLAVFGAMLNKYTDFYDPYKGDLVMISGQLYIIDLLEHLEDITNCIQTNTDGIIVEYKDEANKQEIIRRVEEWEKRTGYVIKKVPIHNIWQRDVNCYMYQTDEDNELHCVGEAVGLYNSWDDIFDRGSWQVKEPPIFSHIVVDYLINNILPEKTVEKYKNKLRMYQFICKKGSYDYTNYELTDINNNLLSEEKLQGVNRAFPLKYNGSIGMIYKYKNNNGKISKAKVANLPDSVFVFDEDITIKENVLKIQQKIDYNYYIQRGYEKIKEFIKIPEIKDILLYE